MTVQFHEDDLVEAARRGDESAFVALFRTLQPPLLRYLGALAPSWADDLAAETWADVAAGLATFEGDETAFRAWVFTIARRRRVDLVRAQLRRPPGVSDDELLNRPDGTDVAAAAEERSGTEHALRLVATLPPDQAEAVLLRVIGGLDVPRTASVMGRSPGAVRVLVHRGLRRLREQLARSPV